MKTALRLGLFMVLLAFTATKASAQCAASNILIQNIEQVGTQTPGSCSVKFDLSFQLQSNNGNKFIFLHGWEVSDYPDFFDCVNGEPSGSGAIQPPEGTDLANSFINIGIDNNGVDPVLLTTYPPDAAVTLSTADSINRTVLPNGDAFFVIHGVTAVFPVDCDEAFLIAFDFWSTQTAQAQIAQCVNCNVLYPVNFFEVSGIAVCLNLVFAGTITNNSDTTISGYTLVYADVNADDFLAVGLDALIQDTVFFTIPPGPGTFVSIGGLIPDTNINRNLLVVTVLNLGGGQTATQINVLLSTQCAQLPVEFKSFTATRINASNVSLRWETATEIDNKGFVVLRNLGGEKWDVVTFIKSLAPDGSSDLPITYSFNDINSNRGMSQYRLQQVDLNGTARYSEIRAVRGIGQSLGVIVYPVPSTDGRVNVVFDNVESTRDVTLLDMSGRTLKQWRSVTGNTLRIDNIRTGMYTLRIQDKTTGSVVTEKIVVSSY